MLGFLGLLVAAVITDSDVPSQNLDRTFLGPGLSLMLTVAAVVGSFAFTSDYRAGAFSRRVLLFQRHAALVARGTTTTLAASFTGVVVGLAFGLSGTILGGAWHMSVQAVLAFAGIAGMGALWGFALGSLIRNHLVTLFVVPFSLVLQEFLADSLKPTEAWLFAVQASDWASHAAFNIPASGSFLGAAGWLLVVSVAASWAFLERDLA
ncbi:hypothetical protein AB0N65_15235 [Paenarthrobacter sp. NPDC089322]|uniref:hypothetical protein n=1 Tax=Paenarthrobacter sp. NPDC089322 TaxID=3155065 RepID=UPI003423C921